MEYYLFCLIISVIVNVVPFGGPPTWAVLVFFVWKFNLNTVLVILVGLIGSTIGRFILSKVAYKILAKVRFSQVDENLDLFSELINKNRRNILLFTILYCIFPTPTNWLFIPAGKEKRGLWLILLGHFIGRIVNYTYSVLLALRTIELVNEISNGNIFSVPNLIVQMFLLMFSVSLLFIDWHAFMRERKVRFNFRKK